MSTETVNMVKTVNRFEAVGRIVEKGKDKFGRGEYLRLLIDNSSTKKLAKKNTGASPERRGTDDPGMQLYIRCSEGFSIPEIKLRDKIKVTGHITEANRPTPDGKQKPINTLIAETIEPVKTLVEEYFGDGKGIYQKENYATAYVKGVVKSFYVNDRGFMYLSVEVDRDNQDVLIPRQIKISGRKPLSIETIEKNSVIEAVCSITSKDSISLGAPIEYTNFTIQDIAVFPGSAEAEEAEPSAGRCIEKAHGIRG